MSIRIVVNVISRSMQLAKANEKLIGGCLLGIWAIYAYKEYTKPEASLLRKIITPFHDFFDLTAFKKAKDSYGLHLYPQKAEPEKNAMDVKTLLKNVEKLQKLVGAVDNDTSTSEMNTLYNRIFKENLVSIQGNPLLFIEIEKLRSFLGPALIKKEAFFAMVFQCQDQNAHVEIRVENTEKFKPLELFKYALEHYKVILTFIQNALPAEYELYLLQALTAQVKVLRDYLVNYSKNNYLPENPLKELPDPKLQNLQTIIKYLEECKELKEIPMKSVIEHLKFIQFAYEQREEKRYLVGCAGITFLHHTFLRLAQTQINFVKLLFLPTTVLLFFKGQAIASSIQTNIMKLFRGLV